MTNTNTTPAAVQSLTETGWPVPEGIDMAIAEDLAAGRPRWWHRVWAPRPESPVDALRRWVWASITESFACRRAQAARAACTLRRLGVACGTCRGTGVDPTGTPTVQRELWTRPTMQPRCRLCAGIGLLADSLTSPHAATTVLVDEHQAPVDEQADDGLNPYQQRTGVRGQGRMRALGENRAADAVVTLVHDGARMLLMVERGDGLGWALPGGHVDPGEAPRDAAIRELAEETGLDLTAWPTPLRISVDDEQGVPDPRATDDAWMVTTPVRVWLGEVDELPAVIGADDARRAAWVQADTYGQLVTGLRVDYDGTVFAAHHTLLAELLS